VNRSTVLTLAAGVPVAVLLLAGCGGSSTSDTAAAAPTASPSAAGAARAAGGRGPAASGEIAAVSGRTLQVQSSSSQTAVTWSAATKFTKAVRATLAVGDCVTVTGTPGTGSAITATSVRVVSTGGSCTVVRPTGTPRAFPTGGAQRGAGGSPPSGAPGAGRDFATAFGTVKSVSGSTVVVSGTLRSGGRFGGSPGATPSAAPTASAVTVTIGSSVSVLTSAAGTGADVKVGTCATAIGKADTTGTVAATSIALSPKGADGCAARFGGFGGLGG
jgi:hypothetical protein